MGLTQSSSLLHKIFTYDFTQQELMDGQEEEMLPSSKESQAEMKVLQEEMQLVLKKEREAQVPVRTQSLSTETILLLFFYFVTSFLCAFQKELSALRSSLAHQQATRVDAKDISDHQVRICLFLSQLDSIFGCLYIVLNCLFITLI